MEKIKLNYFNNALGIKARAEDILNQVTQDDAISIREDEESGEDSQDKTVKTIYITIMKDSYAE